MEDIRPLDLRIRTSKKPTSIWSPASQCEKESIQPNERLIDERPDEVRIGNWNVEVPPSPVSRASSADRSFQASFLKLKLYQ